MNSNHSEHDNNSHKSNDTEDSIKSTPAPPASLNVNPSTHHTIHSTYTESTIQAAYTLLRLYTQMAQELCNTLAASYPEQSAIAKLPYIPDCTSFEALFDLMDEQEYDTDPDLFYKNENWFIFPHGEHCLFVSSSGISIEVHIYDYRWIDAGFFNNFVKSISQATSHPYSELAQKLITAIAPADFQSFCAMLKYLSAQGKLLQHDAVNFSLA